MEDGGGWIHWGFQRRVNTLREERQRGRWASQRNILPSMNVQFHVHPTLKGRTTHKLIVVHVTMNFHETLSHGLLLFFLWTKNMLLVTVECATLHTHTNILQYLPPLSTRGSLDLGPWHSSLPYVLLGHLFFQKHYLVNLLKTQMYCFSDFEICTEVFLAVLAAHFWVTKNLLNNHNHLSCTV